jgi:hypothetical protein
MLPPLQSEMIAGAFSGRRGECAGTGGFLFFVLLWQSPASLFGFRGGRHPAFNFRYVKMRAS